MGKQFSQHLKRATLIPAITLGALTLMLVVTLASVLWAMWWANHTNQVIDQALSVQKLVSDCEGAARGFFLTGQRRFLDPYQQAQPKMGRTLDTLQTLAADSTSQRAQADKISREVRQWLDRLRFGLARRAESDRVPTTQMMDRGALAVDSITESLNAFLAVEYQLRNTRTHGVYFAGVVATIVVIAALVLVALIQGFAVRRSILQATLDYRDALDLAAQRSELVKQALRDLDHEMKAVADIQRSLLPITLPPIPLLSLAASYQTSQRVGGDYYDFFKLPSKTNTHGDDRPMWGLLIADVSGHGTPAAVLMAVTHSIAHGFDQPTHPPSALLGFVNRRLCDRYTADTGSFVTAFYAIFDPNERTLTYSSAGHNPPRLKRRDAPAFAALDDAQGFPLGLVRDEAYLDRVVHLNNGDMVVLYTDGITESRRDDNQCFGVDRLDAAVLSNATEPPANIVQGVIAAVNAYTGDVPVQDDRTLLILRVTEDVAAERANETAAPQAIVGQTQSLLSVVEDAEAKLVPVTLGDES